jgi:subtilisin-like proprotein convertase family protein
LAGGVVRLRHNYGAVSLVQLTGEQEAALRDAGYAVRILEDADRIGLGPYSFTVPTGPSGLPIDLVKRERREETDTYLVRFIGPAADEWLASLKGLGGEVLTPIPYFTYLTKIPANRRQEIGALPFVEWMGPYHPAFKLSGELVQEHERGTLSEAAQKLNVLIFRWTDVEGALNKIRAMQGEILNRSDFDFYDLITVKISGKRVPDLARMTETYAVEVVAEPKLEDESSTQILAGQIGPGNVPFRPIFAEPSYQDWLTARNLDGSNVTIGYVDEGVLNVDPTGHLSGRVNETACGTAGLTGTGHGHFGAANAGGVCSHTSEGTTGFKFGLGVAPGVNFINLPYLNPSAGCFNGNPANFPDLARLTVTSPGPVNGVPGTIQNNSWGSGAHDSGLVEDVSYGSDERTYDMLARDADSTTAGNQPLITCFSAGNEGANNNGGPAYGCPTVASGQKDCAVTLTRPHAAKNVLTTGSSSTYRPGAGATNIDDRSFFSSQGPTMDGRIKPDFMAPGGAAGSFAALSSALLPGATVGGGINDGFHGLSAGTSFATPQTAGGAALLVQWWQRFASAVPSPAMVKALLINSARDMQSGNTTDTIPNRHEGWGRWNLGSLLEPGTPVIVSAPPVFKKTSGLPAVYLDQGIVLGTNGSQFQLRLAPADLAQPLRATLVWTDAPGAVASCPSLVNNLDLELVQNGTTVLRGNAMNSGLSIVPGGPADSINNVEQVIQPAPSGLYTLTVKAVTLNGDGLPGNADTTDQDFALVVSNATVVSTPILAPGTLTPADACSGVGSGGNGVLDPGETLTVSVPLVNSGDLTATSVSAALATPPPGVTIVDGNAAYPNIAPGAVGTPLSGDTISITLADSLGCGSSVDLTLNVSTGQGTFPVPLHFKVGSTTLTTQDLSGSTGVVNDDINSPSNFTTPSATSGTIQNVTLDVNLSSPLTGRGSLYLLNDFSLELISPTTTGVTLHNNPLPCSSLTGNYPNSRLPQEGSLDSFKGQNAGGIWTLRVTDRINNQCSGGGPAGPCSSATVNSWSLHLTRESAAACNTCVVSAAPPEVSSPASSSPMSLTYNAATGEVIFTWENLGVQADMYRLYQGTVSALAGTGVTSANTAPIQCGIVSTGTTLVPVPGTLFFLVAGQKGALIGPLGNATDPVTFPRSASQTCP